MPKYTKEQLPELKAHLAKLKEREKQEKEEKKRKQAQPQEPNLVTEPTYEPEAPNIYEDLIGEPKEPDSATNITPPWPDYSDWPEPKEPPEAYVAHEAQPQATKEATPPAQLNTVQAVSKEQEKPTPRQKSMEESNGIKIINAYELLNMSFPEPKYAVEGIIPEGLTVLAGGPKIGKSALVLHLFVAISLGGYALGRIEVTEGNVLYLALEDTPRRLKTRLARIIKDTQCTEEDAKKLAKSSLVTQCPRQNEGGIDFIRQHLGANPDTRLVIIDTLQKFRRTQTGKGNNQYAEDYDTVAEIKALADEFHVAILLVHHVKKGVEVDWLNTISGTQGIAGAADTILILERSRNSNLGKLSITGRDVEEKSYDMEVDKFSWILKGESQPEESPLSGNNQKIVDYLELHAGDSYTPAEITKKLELNKNTVLSGLNRLNKKGIIKKNVYGGYYMPKEPDTPEEPKE